MNKSQQIAAGLNYLNVRGECECSVTHDAFMAGIEDHDPDRDTPAMTALGWEWDDTYDCWFIWV